MATQVQWRRGTTAQVAAFTGAVGEIVVDTTTHQMSVQDGVTPGGFYTGLATGGTFHNITITGTSNVLTGTFTGGTWGGLTLTTPTITTPTMTGGSWTTASLLGTATAPTVPLPNASTAIATTAFVQNAVQFYAPLNLAIAVAMTMATLNSPSGT